jgi:beta-galactosidase
LLLSYYKPLRESGYSVDIVSPLADLSQYKLVIAPGLSVLTNETTKNLLSYVQQGGNLVLGQRCGMKDDDHARWPVRQPGPLASLLGGIVEQYFAIPSTILVSGEWGNLEGKIYVEQLRVTAPDTKVVMRYGRGNGWIDGTPAVLTRSVGRGTITYLGIWMNDDGMRTAVKQMLASAGVSPEFPELPNGVEVYRRIGDKKRVFVVVNFSPKRQDIQLPEAMENVLEGGKSSSVTLPVYGVAVLKTSR